MQTNFKQSVVQLIFDGKAEEALKLLSKNYKVSNPKLKIGLPKGHKVKPFGCYTAKNATISLANSDTITNPFIILHEFYHHLRTSIDKKYRSTEKHADQFAMEFIKAYKQKKLDPKS